MQSLRGYFGGKTIGRWFSGIKYMYNDINPATLTGAIDIIVVEQEDGSFTCGPFHVRFGKLGTLRPADKSVDIFLNGELVEDIHMKLGSAGEAYFVDESDQSVESDNELSNPAGLGLSGSYPARTESLFGGMVRARSADDLTSAVAANSDPGTVGGHSGRRRRRKLHREALKNGVQSEEDDSPCDVEIDEEMRSCPDDELSIRFQYLFENELDTSHEASRGKPSNSNSTTIEALSIEADHRNWSFNRDEGTPLVTPTLTASSTPVAPSPLERKASLGVDSYSVKQSNGGVYLEDLIAAKVDDSLKSEYIYTHADHRHSAPKITVDVPASDPGYRSDGENSSSLSPTYPVITELKLSLCGGLQADEVLPDDKFYQKLVSYEDFIKDPDTILANPNLVVMINGKYYPWTIAAPIVLSVICFQTELPHQSLRRLQDTYLPKKKSRRKHWFSWGARYDDQPQTMQQSQQPTQQTPNIEIKGDTSNSNAVPPVEQVTAVTITVDANETVVEKVRQKKIWLTSEEIRHLNLRSGRNDIEFRVTTKFQGTTRCVAAIYLWKWNDRIIISDVDGTITKSDVLGHVLPILGKDWTQPGVARLYQRIEENGYRFIYLSARAIGQANVTRSYLHHVVQEHAFSLPDGPVLLFPNSLLLAFHREVILKKPELFKIECMKEVRALFPPFANPLFAGFGNKPNDVIAYSEVGIHPSRIFTVNSFGLLRNEFLQLSETSYTLLSQLVDHICPPLLSDTQLSEVDATNFSGYTYWREPVPDFDANGVLKTHQSSTE